MQRPFLLLSSMADPFPTIHPLSYSTPNGPLIHLNHTATEGEEWLPLLSNNALTSTTHPPAIDGPTELSAACHKVLSST